MWVQYGFSQRREGKVAPRETFVVQLKEYYEEAGIAVHALRCGKIDECQKYAGVQGLRPGTEPHIGTNYGTTPRIVIVSLDAGGEDWLSEDIEARTASLERVQTVDDAGNPHMRGTFEFASLLASRLPDASLPMPRVALLNSCRCRATDGTMNQLPRLVHNNCLSHVEHELEILKPDIVWLQGAILRDYFFSKIEPLDPADSSVQHATSIACHAAVSITEAERAEALAKIGRLASCSSRPLIIYTCHPSARYGLWNKFKAKHMAFSAAVLNALAPIPDAQGAT